MRLLSTSAVLAALVVAAPARAQDPLADQARKALDRGVAYLRAQAAARGDWEGILVHYPGGVTALATLALLTAEVPPDDPLVQSALKTLRQIESDRTYVVGLQTMVFARAGFSEDRERIQRNVKWLIDNRRFLDGKFRGWGYSAGRDRPDYSNSQYALLGLHEAHRAGAVIPPEVWESIRRFYIDTQSDGGGWPYLPREADVRAPNPVTLNMSYAGLCGLLIAGMDVNVGREKPLGDGSWQNCGQYAVNREVAKAMDFLAANFPVDARGKMVTVPSHYYWLYGVERAGRLSGQRFIGKHDWYRLGCEYLVEHQQGDGSFHSGTRFEQHPVIATSFAVLFLAKGRTPILISKLAHGPGEDWNNDHNDARNLVEYASRELFKNQPLGWQVFDVRKTADAQQADLPALVADLGQTPIVYFNGHRAPEFTGLEVEGEAPLLRQYVEQGGFIFAEACCGDQRFHDGFVALMEKLFPGHKLKLLGLDHPIWQAGGDQVRIPPEAYKDFELYGIEMGCKTVVVYSRRDLSCHWESNQHDKGASRAAFRLGANVIAYATGMEPPKSRRFDLPVDRDPAGKVPRGYLKVAQLRHTGDWEPAPRAMRQLMGAVQGLGLDADKRKEGLSPAAPDFFDYRFLYQHGRARFEFSPKERERLKFNLESGGLLLADACCGSQTFDQAFREEIARVWPDKKLERIPLNDELFSAALNGAALTKVKCRREGPDGQPQPEFSVVDPYLEGIKHNGRWVVIYSKYDLGCALEGHKATNCLGHDPESALRLATAAVLYASMR